MRRIAALAARLAAIASLGMTGCCYYELRDCYDDCSMNVRNQYLARMAWHRCNGAFDGHSCFSDFGHGFRDGYAAVAGGADGCCPSMPPRCYWGSCYRGSDGQCAANAWFDGYARGAIAAEADGLSSSGRITMRQPGCGMNCAVRGPSMSATAVPLPSPSAYPVGSATPPPPAPPSMAPSIPADEAYESYNEGGLYYE